MKVVLLPRFVELVLAQLALYPHNPQASWPLRIVGNQPTASFWARE